MTFFANGAINRVLMHSAVQSLAQGMGGVFVFVYMLKAGVPVPGVLCALAAMVAGRFVLRPMVLPLAQRFGVRTTLILGTLGEAAIFPILPSVHGLGGPLVAAIAVGSVGSVLYWTSYHAYFAALGDAEQRGSQIGVREAVNALTGVLGPLIGGWALATLGPLPAFVAAAVTQAAAAAPLLGGPSLPVERLAPVGLRSVLRASALMAADGWLSAGFYYTWQLALFMSLGQSFAAYGGAMALASLAAAVCGLALGRLIDLGHHRRSVLIAYAIAASVILLRANALGSPWLALLANALGALVLATQAPALMTFVYNEAKASPCTLRFHIATEGGWDLGCGLCCLTGAALTWAGWPISAAILLALLGAAASCVGLLASYRQP